MPKTIVSGPRFALVAALVIALTLGSIAVLMGNLRVQGDAEAERALHESEQRGLLLAGAVSNRLGLFFRNADFSMRLLSARFASQDAQFMALLRSLESQFAPGALQSMRFADAQGEVQFSSNANDGPRNIRGEDFFAEHLAGQDHLFVGVPRLTGSPQRWSIPLSRPIRRNGRFAGVAVMSIAPGYLSELLQQFLLGREDNVALFDAKGQFFARARDLEKVLGKSLPAPPLFTSDPASSGIYRAISAVTGEARLMSWHRVANTGLVVGVGIDRSTVLEPLHSYQSGLWRVNHAIAALLLVCGLALLMLLRRNFRQQSELASSEQRFRNLTGLSSDWYWERMRNRA